MSLRSLSKYRFPDIDARCDANWFVLTDETNVFEGRRIDGCLKVDLTYKGTSITEKQFPNLESIGGRFTIWNNDHLQVVSLPKLKSIGHKFYLERVENLTSVSLPNLKTTGDGDHGAGLYIDSCNTLASLTLPLLQNIKGALVVKNCSELNAVRMPNLEKVQATFAVSNLENITSLDFGALMSANFGHDPPDIITESTPFAVHKVLTFQIKTVFLLLLL